MTDLARQVSAGLARLAAVGRAGMWQAAAAQGLSATQAEILLRVARQPQRVGALAAHLGVTAATISDSVATLQAKGLVSGHPDPDDRRARQFRPTAQGQHIAALIPPAPEPMLAAIEALPAPDRAALLMTLIRLIRHLQEAGAIPVQRVCVGCRFFRPNIHDDAAAPHHCDYVNAAFGNAALRLDCDEYEAAPAETAAAAWRHFETA